LTLLIVPEQEGEPWPTLGPQVAAWIEKNLTHGPGDLHGKPAHLDSEKRLLLYKMYEVYPREHPQAGRRRFRRAAVSLRKGSAKTEFAAWIAAAELHPRGPVRTVSWANAGSKKEARWQPIGGGVVDPYIPMVAYTEEQSEELAYGALRAILSAETCAVRKDFDIGLERIMRKDGHGKAVALAGSPDARDGARTTFQHFDEALAIDTPIATPDGWTTMGAVKPGDLVLGSAGTPVQVLGCSAVHQSRGCYHVTFRDGTYLVCDADHLWCVRDRSHRGPIGRKAWHVVRTSELLDGGLRYEGSGIRAMWRWAVPVQQAAEGAEAALPVDPYALGAWLGDGERASACISSHSSDIPHWRQQLPAFNVLADRGDTVRFIPRGLRSRLRKAGLLGRKHIPTAYMRASASQRLALLQGLFDTDGHVSTSGAACFVQTDTQLTSQVLELLRLCGYRPRVTRIMDPRSRAGGYWKVTAHARADVPLFRMERKARRVGAVPSRRIVEELAIVAVDRVDSVPVRCIAVDAPDRLYQAGTGMVLTHNTHRFTLPRLRRAHATMMANLPKRKAADSWSLETTTAPAPGENSIAESTMDYARSVAEKRSEDSQLFFYHREAGPSHDLSTPEGVRAAVLEASGPIAEWSNIEAICDQWKDPTNDPAYLERLWLNRLVQASSSAFDSEKWGTLAAPAEVPNGQLITLGFNGGRYNDSVGVVATVVATGYQFVVWAKEKPLEPKDKPAGWVPWEAPEGELSEAIASAFKRWKVWRLYANPSYWETTIATWCGLYGEDRAIAWPTSRPRKMSDAVRGFASAIVHAEVSHAGDVVLSNHIGATHKRALGLEDEKGEKLWTIQTDRPGSPRSIALAGAAVLSWQARCDAIKSGANITAASIYKTREPYAINLEHEGDDEGF
jgi:hypothetical protein